VRSATVKHLLALGAALSIAVVLAVLEEKGIEVRLPVFLSFLMLVVVIVVIAWGVYWMVQSDRWLAVKHIITYLISNADACLSSGEAGEVELLHKLGDRGTVVIRLFLQNLRNDPEIKRGLEKCLSRSK
jgi:hypothetical protein